MKKWTIPLAAILGSVLVVAAHAALRDGGDGPHARIAKWLHGDVADHVGDHLDHVASELGLGAQQRKQVATVVLAAFPELQLRGVALRDAHARQLELIHAAALDEAAIREAGARLGEAQGEFAVVVARLLRDIHAQLTPEQLARAKALHGSGLLGLVQDHVRGIGQGLRQWAERQ